jgi:hypothetical protein
LAILVFQLVVSRVLWTGSGLLARRHPALGRGLLWFSAVYFVAMVVRYVWTVALAPGRRWFDGAIPIVFHWVLALYVYVLSRYHRTPDDVDYN